MAPYTVHIAVFSLLTIKAMLFHCQQIVAIRMLELVYGENKS